MFQVEYAHKAVENGGAILGLTCSDGVVLGVEKLQYHKLALPGSGRQIHTIDTKGKHTQGMTGYHSSTSEANAPNA